MMAVWHLCVVWFVTFLCNASVGQPLSISQNAQSTGSTESIIQPLPGKSNATNAQGFLEIGYSYYQKADYKEAIGPLKMAISLEPTNCEAKLWLGFTYYYLNDFDAAAAVLTTAAQCEPGKPESHYWLGNALYALRRYDQAVVAYRQALALAPNESRSWLGLGYCQYGQRAFRSAAESFRQCALVEPTNFFANVWLGHSLVQLDRVEDATTAFSNAVSLRPRDYEANLGRGMTLLRLSRFGQATSSFEQALEGKPAARSPRWGLFLCYLATGQIAKISHLHLGVLPAISILLMALYLPAAVFIFRQSLRLGTRSYPNMGFALGWCGVTLYGQTVLFVIFSMLFSWSASQALGLSVSLPALPLIVAAVLGFARQPWGEPFSWPPHIPGGRLFLAALAAFGGALLFESGYTWLVERITGRPMPGQMIVSWLNAGVHSRWLTFLGVALLAPAGEEILFRGLLFGAMRGRLSARWTILVTAALFALVHLQPIYFMPLFAMGLVLGWARDRSGGLSLPIVLHCVNNCSALLVTQFQSGH